jgi:hypothetical protein
MTLKLMALLLALPNTTYDLPAFDPILLVPIVGAWGADPSARPNAGKSYVVFGKANGGAINLSAIADTNNPTGGFVINGEAALDWSGWSVSSAGDVNGDGLDDLIVGASNARSYAGKSRWRLSSHYDHTLSHH